MRQQGSVTETDVANEGVKKEESLSSQKREGNVSIVVLY
jgi:hypothetical protein